jgi:hypothetical protein
MGVDNPVYRLEGVAGEKANAFFRRRQPLNSIGEKFPR